MKSRRRDRDQGLFIDSLFNNRNEELADEWVKFAINRDNQAKLIEFVRKYRPGSAQPKMLYIPVRGSYNINWRLEFDDGLSTMIHIPIPHAVAFPDEKIRAEVAAMRLVRENTTIPVPEIYAWGTSADNPTGYGPFIVMEYIKHTKYLEHVIKDRMESVGSNDPKKGMPDKTLLKAYRQMANIMLQLSTIEGSAIGYPSLSKDLTNKQSTPSSSSSSKVPFSLHSTHQPQSRVSRVHRRLISQSTNDLITMGGLPPSVLPPTNKTYNTSHEYYEAMADMHLAHLTFQRNNTVLGRSDGRESYVARQLFRRLARDGQLTQDDEHDDNAVAGQQKELFKLWCDDMRPTSVLLDENDDVVGVIDWEMSYFAPTSFHYNPPWWLVIDRPEFSGSGLSSWVKEYERRLPLFLKAMELEEEVLKEAREKAKDGRGSLDNHQKLLTVAEAGKGGHPLIPMSKRMKRNWDNGRFFVDYCARRGYAFDPIYWKYIDKKFFGKNKKTGLLLKNHGYKGRLHLLSEKERAQMEPFVAWKMEAWDGEKVIEWDQKDAQAVLAACLAGKLGDIKIPKPRVIPWTMTDRSSSPPSPA
ncbi:phosphotransferase [Diaporthe amygdali]|uniref:phosphotransferase n=1 Tax=Phomopsis amygdali TaxID=1214568 RepID=UPI0022FE2776|nr:phosphotransferase [Diaporthe amygdali]KAJ0116685.1 phosphotransferase [Diaporthe amygdali]